DALGAGELLARARPLRARAASRREPARPAAPPRHRGAQRGLRVPAAPQQRAGGRGPVAALSAAVAGRSLGTIGFESEFVPFAQVTRLREKLAPAELVPLATVDRLRWTKDVTEVAAIARAVEIADAAFAHIAGVLRPGLSERDVAVELEMCMRRFGAERLAFESVVASGPRAALPHGRATDRMLCRGDLVTLDFGA